MYLAEDPGLRLIIPDAPLSCAAFHPIGSSRPRIGRCSASPLTERCLSGSVLVYDELVRVGRSLHLTAYRTIFSPASFCRIRAGPNAGIAPSFEDRPTVCLFVL